MSHYMLQLACRFHKDAVLIEDARAGDMICSECGLVVGERMIDVSSEWRTFADDDSGKSVGRVGAAENLLFDHTNLETMTTFRPKIESKSGRKFPQQLSQSSSTADRALHEGHNEIRQLCSRVNLSKAVVNSAFLIFKECYENKFIRGRAKDVIIAVCIFMGCRKEGSGRTIKEICDLTHVDNVPFGRVFRKVQHLVKETIVVPNLNMENIIPRFCNQLDLKNERLVQRTALHIANSADKFCDVQGRKPDSIASAAIYLACQECGERITMTQIKAVTSTSEVVTRTICKLMTPSLQKLLPSGSVSQRSLV